MKTMSAEPYIAGADSVVATFSPTSDTDLRAAARLIVGKTLTWICVGTVEGSGPYSGQTMWSPEPRVDGLGWVPAEDLDLVDG
ncbi:UNVERIFIED_ORG: hypothetical protein ABID57_001328 [Arthrobacter sp. UYEF1]